jgi:hypothetical protein
MEGHFYSIVKGLCNSRETAGCPFCVVRWGTARGDVHRQTRKLRIEQQNHIFQRGKNQMKSRNEQALKVIAVALAALTYASAVVYGDIQFLTVMDKAFPHDPVMRALAMAGAVMTAVSALTLPVALHWWFSPGLQFLWGIAFWCMDILALGLNSILAYELAIGTHDSLIATWQIFSPATPLLAVIGWGVAFLLDPSHKERHARAEMEADQIDVYADQMRKAANSDEVYQEILEAAKMRAREFAESLSGRRNGGTSEPSRPACITQMPGVRREPAQTTAGTTRMASKPGRNGHSEDPLA